MWTHRRSGKNHKRGQNDHRDPFERDSTRVIHCAAFRRLQRRTQILGTDEGDFHRTRLTHSLEVASIGRSIVKYNAKQDLDPLLRSILPNDDLINVICLMHDIGHPPFGHGGEVALNFMMRDYGGFEGNAQTLRLLTKLEDNYGEFGLDLTRRTLLGLLKYPVCRTQILSPLAPQITSNIRINDWLPPKAYYVSESNEVNWILEPFTPEDIENFQSLKTKPLDLNHGQAKYKSFDCSIMDIADDIAYGVHDLEDAIHLRLITREAFDTAKLRELFSESSLNNNSEQLLNQLFSTEITNRKQAIGELVNYFITSTKIIITSEKFTHEFLRYNMALESPAKNLLEYFIQCIYKEVIDSQAARTFEYGGQTVLTRLFEALSSNPTSLLDEKNRRNYQASPNQAAKMRVVCDYIANMTDEYAHRMHEKLFGFNTRAIF